MRRLIAALLVALLALPAIAHDLGPAGLFSRKNSETLPPLTIASDRPIAEAPLVLKSGTYYEIDIVADGSAELQLSGADFFRAIWIDEIVINDLEVRPMGLHSLEFDDEGTVELDFIAIRPGRYELRTQTATLQVTIE